MPLGVVYEDGKLQIVEVKISSNEEQKVEHHDSDCDDNSEESDGKFKKEGLNKWNNLRMKKCVLHLRKLLRG